MQQKKSSRGSPPRAAEDRPQGEVLGQLAARCGITVEVLLHAMRRLDVLVVPASVEVPE